MRDFMTAPIDDNGYIDFRGQDAAAEVVAALKAGFMVCRSQPSRNPEVCIEFGNLRDAQRLHRALVVLAANLTK